MALSPHPQKFFQRGRLIFRGGFEASCAPARDGKDAEASIQGAMVGGHQYAAIQTIPNRSQATSSRYGRQLWWLSYHRCGEPTSYGWEESCALDCHSDCDVRGLELRSCASRRDGRAYPKRRDGHDLAPGHEHLRDGGRANGNSVRSRSTRNARRNLGHV